jgi:hypothetical protein
MRLFIWLTLLLMLNVQVRASLAGVPTAQADDEQKTDVTVYPRLVLVPGTAAYYAPDLGLNYFYYDGSFWLYQADEWHRSGWYNGPWAKVSPSAIPLSLLQIPVAYYNQLPSYFSGGQAGAPPRWDMHWGPAWARYRGVWDRPGRGAVAVPAPRPEYQRPYTGARYPDVPQQLTLRAHYDSYRSHEPIADLPSAGPLSGSGRVPISGITNP